MMSMSTPHRVLSYKSSIFTGELGIQMSVLIAILAYLWYSKQETAIIYLAPTIDALFSAIGFFRIQLIQNMTKSQTLKQLRSLYRVSLVDRYLYYFSVSVIYQITLVITWGYFRQVLYYALIISFCPILLNKILLESFVDIIMWLNLEKITIIQVGVSKFIAYLINFMSEVSVNLRPDVHYTELLPLFRNTHQTLNFFYSFISSFLLATLIHYVKSNGNHIYAKIIRYFYNYKTGDHIGRIDAVKAKEKFTDVIVRRRWSELLRPDVTQTLFHIYKNNEDSDIIKNLITKFHFTFLTISAIWTVSWFFKSGVVASILSIILLIFEIFKKKETEKEKQQQQPVDLNASSATTSATTSTSVTTSTKATTSATTSTTTTSKISDKTRSIYVLDYSSYDYNSIFKPVIQLVFPISTLLISYYTEYHTKYLYLTLCSELGYYLFSNNLFIGFIDFLLQKVKESIGILTTYRKLDFFLLTTAIYLKIMSIYHFGNITIHVDLNQFKGYTLVDYFCTSYYLQGEIDIAMYVSVLYFITNFDLNSKRYLLFLLTILGSFSNYNNWHLGFMIFMGHITLNLIYYFRPHYLIGQNIMHDYDTMKKFNGPGVHINTDTLKIFESYHPSNVQYYKSATAVNSFDNLSGAGLNDNEIVTAYQNTVRHRPTSRKVFTQVSSLDNSLPMGMNSKDDMCRSIYLKKFESDLSKSCE